MTGRKLAELASTYMTNLAYSVFSKGTSGKPIKSLRKRGQWGWVFLQHQLYVKKGLNWERSGSGETSQETILNIQVREGGQQSDSQAGRGLKRTV